LPDTLTHGCATQGLFKRGKEDCFDIPVSHDLGELKKVHIGIDQQMRHRGSSWLLDSLTAKLSRWTGSQEQRDTHTWVFRNRASVQLGGDPGIPEDMYVFSDPQDPQGILPYHSIGARPPHIFPSEGCFREAVDICIAAQVPADTIRFSVSYQETYEDAQAGKVHGGVLSNLLDPLKRSHPVVRLQPVALGESGGDGRKGGKMAKGGQDGGEVEEVVVELPAETRKTWDTVVFEVAAARVALRWRHPGQVWLRVTSSNGGQLQAQTEVSGRMVVFPQLERVVYRIHVFTGDLPRAATSAKVSVMLTGEHGRKTNVEQLHPVRLGRHGRSSLHAFGRNKEAVCEFEALDIGAVSEVLLWQNGGVQAEEWYLHRVEVLTLNSTTLEEKGRRTFVWRRWLSPFREANGLQAKLVYEDLKHLEKLTATYSIKIALPRALAPNRSALLSSVNKRGSFSVNASPGVVSLGVRCITIVSSRFPDGITVPLPALGDIKLSRTSDVVVLAFAAELAMYVGQISSMRVTFDRGADLEYAHLVDCTVSGFSKSTFCAMHFSSVRSGAVCLPSCFPRTARLQDSHTRVLRLVKKESAVEPQTSMEIIDDGEAGKDEVEVLVKDSRKTTSKLLVETLETIIQSPEFDEEESLQAMVPACSRLALIELAQCGGLLDKQLEKLSIAFDQESFPMTLQCEIEVHSTLMLMQHVILPFEKWRRVPHNSFELDEIRPSSKFMWNLLYWQCCTSPPDPEAVVLALDTSEFERENEEALFFKVKGIEQDFALLLHFLVLRQIAREHYMPSEVQDEPQHGADADDDIEYGTLRLGWGLPLRALIFPFLFITSLVHVLMTEFVFCIIGTTVLLIHDWLKFRKFEETAASKRQISKKESKRRAREWLRACQGNYMWLNRRTPIQAEERALLEARKKLVGEWAHWSSTWVREFRQQWNPKMERIVSDWTNWFYYIHHETAVGEGVGVKSKAQQKRERVLDELCRFEVVEKHRNAFAMNYSLGKMCWIFFLTLTLFLSLFNMLGMHPLKDAGAELSNELKIGLVDNDFDEEHNTFPDIANPEDVWNFLKNSLAPYITARFVANGRAYMGDLLISPVRLRQVRTQALNSTRGRPRWGYAWAGGDLFPESQDDKQRLSHAICTPASPPPASGARRSLLHDDAGTGEAGTGLAGSGEGQDSGEGGGHSDPATADPFAGDRSFCEYQGPKYVAPEDFTSWEEKDRYWLNRLFLTSHGLWYNKYPDSGYSIILSPEDSTEAIVEKLAALEEAGWIDSATRLVSVEFMCYSQTRDRLSYVGMNMQFTPTGWVLPWSDILSFRPSVFEWAFWVYVLVFVWMVGVETLQMFELGPARYFTNVSNFLDIQVALTILIVFLTQVYINLNFSPIIEQFRVSHLSNTSVPIDYPHFSSQLWGHNFWNNALGGTGGYAPRTPGARSRDARHCCAAALPRRVSLPHLTLPFPPNLSPKPYPQPKSQPSTRHVNDGKAVRLGFRGGKAVRGRPYPTLHGRLLLLVFNSTNLLPPIARYGRPWSEHYWLIFFVKVQKIFASWTVLCAFALFRV